MLFAVQANEVAGLTAQLHAMQQAPSQQDDTAELHAQVCLIATVVQLEHSTC